MTVSFQQTNGLPSITSVAATIAELMGISPPAVTTSNCLQEAVNAAESQGVKQVDRCLIYAADAIGLQMYHKHRSFFDAMREYAPTAITLRSATPPITPVCYASMFTGAEPYVHGIQKKEKPVLACDTIFDALIRAGKKVAIVAVKGSSIDRIFRKRKIHYFSESGDQPVTQRTIEAIRSGRFDFIVAYHCEYDDVLHEKTPFCSEAVEAMRHHLQAFAELSETVDASWQHYRRMIWFAPDHGAHIDPHSGRGVHGDDIPADMQVQHYIGIRAASDDVRKPD